MAIKQLGIVVELFLSNSEVNNLNDIIVNDDHKDILDTIPGPDVSIAYNEDFGNGNKESEIEETAYKEKERCELDEHKSFESKAGSTKRLKGNAAIF